jgi:hypothetical protein
VSFLPGYGAAYEVMEVLEAGGDIRDRDRTSRIAI